MALVERKLHPGLYRNQNPRRSPRTPKSGSATRSLDKCIYLATSDTKLSLGQSLAARLEAASKWAGKKRLHAQLRETLRGVAIRNQEKDLSRAWEGVSEADKGPWSAARDYRRLSACQSEWIGFKPTCCNSRVVAVPIGCNHRLCPLCNAARLEHYREPAREILAAMKNPTFLTLTVPNQQRLTAKTYKELRAQWKSFQRSNKSWITGGLYSMETTFNRERLDWHPHIHAVVDFPWPTTGIPREQFVRLKRMIEFAWLRSVSKEARKHYKRSEFERWLRESAANAHSQDWNRRFRRVTHLRPVKGDNAVYEVIKYVTKSSRFLDIPQAVEEFLRAVRGVRVIQTFGTFYNFNSKLEAPITQEDIDALAAAGLDTKVSPGATAAAFLRCDCGKNKFERLGVYAMHDVEMGEDGRWLLRLTRGRQGSCRGSSLTHGGDIWG
ncbi:protein rep [Edaphobacter bradus]|uniref:protein rep n=1 Tax=Edaphobacter bradus TaxID=2259016 RepID=UPI0021E0DA93|nr:protein rep [Edaphobacter bradus]